MLKLVNAQIQGENDLKKITEKVFSQIHHIDSSNKKAKTGGHTSVRKMLNVKKEKMWQRKKKCQRSVFPKCKTNISVYTGQ